MSILDWRDFFKDSPAFTASRDKQSKNQLPSFLPFLLLLIIVGLMLIALIVVPRGFTGSADKAKKKNAYILIIKQDFDINIPLDRELTDTEKLLLRIKKDKVISELGKKYMEAETLKDHRAMKEIAEQLERDLEALKFFGLTEGAPR